MTEETKPEIPLPDNMALLLTVMRDMTPEDSARLLERWMAAHPPEKGKSNARYKGVNFD